MKELILAYQGEMTLKGLNRGKFEARLIWAVIRSGDCAPAPRTCLTRRGLAWRRKTAPKR